MRSTYAPAVIALALVLTACSSPTVPAAESTESPLAETVETESATTSPEASELSLVVDTTNLVVTSSEGITEVAYTDGAGIVAAITELLGAAPEESEVPVSDPAYPFDRTAFSWDGVRIVVDNADNFASVWITAAESGDVALASTNGVVVGDAVDRALEAGASEPGLPDEVAEGANFLTMNLVPVPGTTSTWDSSVEGSQFVYLEIADDAVTTIHAPMDDFSDL